MCIHNEQMVVLLRKESTVIISEYFHQTDTIHKQHLNYRMEIFFSNKMIT